MRDTVSLLIVTVVLSACSASGEFFPDFQSSSGNPIPQRSMPSSMTSMHGESQYTRFVRPEALVECRGHVLVPAIGMAFVPTGTQPPAGGQYLREESLIPPYRVVPPGASVIIDTVPARLNVDLDSNNRIVNLRCG